MLDSVSNDLKINYLTDYIYELATKIAEGYKQYRIVGDENMESRVVLIEGVRRVLEKSLWCVGIDTMDRLWMILLVFIN